MIGFLKKIFNTIRLWFALKNPTANDNKYEYHKTKKIYRVWTTEDIDPPTPLRVIDLNKLFLSWDRTIIDIEREIAYPVSKLDIN